MVALCAVWSRHRKRTQIGAAAAAAVAVRVEVEQTAPVEPIMFDRLERDTKRPALQLNDWRKQLEPHSSSSIRELEIRQQQQQQYNRVSVVVR